jgi:hypothetical protein
MAILSVPDLDDYGLVVRASNSMSETLVNELSLLKN